MLPLDHKSLAKTAVMRDKSVTVMTLENSKWEVPYTKSNGVGRPIGQTKSSGMSHMQNERSGTSHTQNKIRWDVPHEELTEWEVPHTK